LLLCFAGPSCLDTYTLSLHDALPISSSRCSRPSRSCSAGMDGCSECTCASSDPGPAAACCADEVAQPASSTSAAEKTTVRTTATDRKSTRLNSSHVKISYAVFCLKKK